MSKLRVLDLFSGIGGFSLGLERTGGFETVAFCEIEPFPRRVLAKHWPEVPCYDDVRTLTADRLRADGIAVDIICGGFPCQDISTAGKGAGIADGTRSGLWSEIARLTCELRPRYLIVENVSALLGRGIDRVLGDLAEVGFDAEWHCIPASALGAPHRRDRFWLVAYAMHGRRDVSQRGEQKAAHFNEAVGACSLADAASQRSREARQLRRVQSEEWPTSGSEAHDAADTGRAGLSLPWAVALGQNRLEGGGMPAASHWWSVEPDVGRVAHGVPARVDRLKSLGNAVIPQIPELIGNAILASIQQEAA